jgi:hypothetical protein
MEGVTFPPRAMGATEGQMMRADPVREIIARREGEKARDRSREGWRWIARACGAGCGSAAGNRGKAASGRAQPAPLNEFDVRVEVAPADQGQAFPSGSQIRSDGLQQFSFRRRGPKVGVEEDHHYGREKNSIESVS